MEQLHVRAEVRDLCGVHGTSTETTDLDRQRRPRRRRQAGPLPEAGGLRGQLADLLATVNGFLKVADALDELRLDLPVRAGEHTIEIYADAVEEATEVHLVVTPGTERARPARRCP